MASLYQSVRTIFDNNPMSVYTTRELADLYNVQNDSSTSKNLVTMVVYRLYRKNFVLRSPSQLTDGYYYSKQNSSLLQKIYNDFMLPYDLPHRDALLKKLQMKEFQILDMNQELNLNNYYTFDFIRKYEYILDNTETISFLALLVGFSLCDGSIKGNTTALKLFFRRRSDAELFERTFTSLFPLEETRIYSKNGGSCYTLSFLKSSALAKFVHALGVPAGNKVFQPFTVPHWIYHGSNYIKRSFLSILIGNEGSAPSQGKWRIQFVLSKCPEHVHNLVNFLNQVRAMFLHFDITTSHITLRKQKGRQYNGRFYISGKQNLTKFYKQFSFLYASEKQEVLEELISGK